MAINYTWDVSVCEVYPTKNGKSNVVNTVHWRLRATDDSNNDSQGKPQSAEENAKIRLDTSDLSSFTNWSSLDAAKVQGWVEAALDAEESGAVAALKTKLDAQIAEKITPTSVTKTLG
jgi:hypothetical protein